ncbi:hypothetical protein [Rubellicoccus peritrichatus]|uniref:Uncharacterized protein n=1 Tax=Rubellicoccus peritrichatus TaxID=3080537 RepID=A0AAQ3LAP5_9BACT|nr:hypothetical protein [Puniceicoccus sp. CR14]WOO42365.1 hypothetical protein RZN69_04635 [Puniceicoccus sp. CR14]
MGVDNKTIKKVLLELEDIANKPSVTKSEFVVICIRNEILGRFFLNRALSPEWNSILRTQEDIDLFGEDLQQVYISYLLRVFEDSPQDISDSLKDNIAQITRFNLYRILSFATEQDLETAIQFIDIAKRLSDEPQDIYGATLCEYFVTITKRDDFWPQAKELLSWILHFKLSDREGYATYEPRLDNHSLGEFIRNGLKGVTQHKPIETFDLVLQSLDNLIRLKAAQGNYDPEHDEVYCRRVEAYTSAYASSEELIVVGVTNVGSHILNDFQDFAPEVIQHLDELDWNITKRIRAYLYSLHPKIFADAIKEWISNNIMRIAQGNLSREERFMIDRASSSLKEALLSESDSKELYDAVRAEPDSRNYLEYLRMHFPDINHAERILNWKNERRQQTLSLFRNSLYDLPKAYLAELTDKLGPAKTVWDKDEEMVSEAQIHTVANRSPISETDLSALSNVDMIDYLNAWNRSGRNTDEPYVDINKSALASTFQKVVESTPERFVPDCFNWKRIENPIYHGAGINAVKSLYENDKEILLDKWMSLFGWMLDEQYQTFNESGEKIKSEEMQGTDPVSHYAILDLIKTLIDADNNTQIELRPKIAFLLNRLCTTKQSRLESYTLETSDPTGVYGTAINTIRSRALEVFICFSIWVHKSKNVGQDERPADECSKEFREVLNYRIHKGPILTPPELSILAVELQNLSYLNADWLRGWIQNIFPEDDHVWSKVFASHILYSRCLGWLFHDTKLHYERACRNLDLFRYKDRDSEQIVAQIGTHIFLFYLWEKFALPTEEATDKNLIELFYRNTTNEEKRRTFSKIMHMLRTDEKLKDELVKRSIGFIEYRFNCGNSDEFEGFDQILNTKNFDKAWVLKKYAEILDHKSTDGTLRVYELDHFFGAFETEPEATALCFEKVTKRAATQDHFYLHNEDAKKLLKLFLESDNPVIVNLGEKAQANLLMAEMFEYLAL